MSSSFDASAGQVPTIGSVLGSSGAVETSPLVEYAVTDNSPNSPSVGVWIGPALICALSYALYNIFIKKGSNSIHPVLGGVVLQVVAAVVGSCLLIGIIVKDAGLSNLEYDKQGIGWSICAGLAVGLAEIISFFVSGMGVNAMQSIPIIIGGSVLFGTFLGLVVLKENMSYQGWVGVLFLIIGIILVGTESGK